MEQEMTLQERAFELEQALSDAEMIAITEKCGYSKCAFARAGVCKADTECLFTQLKRFLLDIMDN